MRIFYAINKFLSKSKKNRFKRTENFIAVNEKKTLLKLNNLRKKRRFLLEDIIVNLRAKPIDFFLMFLKKIKNMQFHLVY
jgi:hypothetical protein